MKPFYWQGTTNFGDYLNSWLWPAILDGYLSEDDDIRLIGVGSLLKSTLNYLQGTKVIFGTGSGYGAYPSKSDFKDWRFYFVRGPLTAKCFDLTPEKAIVDGAWLISQIEEYKRIPEKKGIGFVPHWTSAETGNWQKICQLANIKYIDPTAELHFVLKQIATCEVVLTESLHGAIMADYFRSPWVPIAMSPKFLPFKWVDWFYSVNLDPHMATLPLSDCFEYIYCRQDKKNVTYSADLAPIEYEIRESASDGAIKANPGKMYRAKINVKRKARDARTLILKKSLDYRDNIFVDSWNKKHQEKISALLTELSSGRNFLSSDSTRETKLSQLHDVTHKLKMDYDKGAFQTNKKFS